MPNGIDYRLISELGGAKARGAAQAIGQEQGMASLRDYMAKAGAKTAIGGETGLPGYYEKEMRKDAYIKDVQAKWPMIQQMITVGDKPGLDAMNQDFAATHGADLHTTQLIDLVPGQFADVMDIKPGADIMQMDPNITDIDPEGTYQIQTRIGVDGQTQITGITPAAPPKAPTAEKTIETGEGFFQWNPETTRYDIPVGPSKPKAGAGDGGGFKQAQGLRKEYITAATDYRKIRDSYARVQESGTEPSAAGDLALIFNYMKMLDPGSVVRESEFATAAATGAWGERVKAAGLKILEGERLSPVMRTDFITRASMLQQRQTAQHGRRKSEYTRLAKSFNINPEQVIVDLSDPVIEEQLKAEKLAQETQSKFKILSVR